MTRGQGPGNSPDLSPIENLWTIVKEERNKMGTTTSEKILIQNVQVAWHTDQDRDPWQPDVWHAGMYPTAWGLHRKTNSELVSFFFCFSDG